MHDNNHRAYSSILETLLNACHLHYAKCDEVTDCICFAQKNMINTKNMGISNLSKHLLIDKFVK